MEKVVVIHGLTETDGNSKIFTVLRTSLPKNKLIKSIKVNRFGKEVMIILPKEVKEIPFDSIGIDEQSLIKD